MKKNKKIQLKTKHLCISPKTLEELKLALVYRLDDNLKRDRDPCGQYWF